MTIASINNSVNQMNGTGIKNQVEAVANIVKQVKHQVKQQPVKIATRPGSSVSWLA